MCAAHQKIQINRPGIGGVLAAPKKPRGLVLLADDKDRNIFTLSSITKHLIIVTTWASEQDSLKSLPIGYFCNGIGIPAALFAAVESQHSTIAMLPRMASSTLFIVGGTDTNTIELTKNWFTTHLTRKRKIA